MCVAICQIVMEFGTQEESRWKKEGKRKEMESLQGSFFLSISLQQRKKTTKQTINHCRLFSCFFRVDISSSLYAPSFQKYHIFFIFYLDSFFVFLAGWAHREEVSVYKRCRCGVLCWNSSKLRFSSSSSSFSIYYHPSKKNKQINFLAFVFVCLSASPHLCWLQLPLFLVHVFRLDVGHWCHRRRVHLVEILQRLVQEVLQ